MPSRRPSTPADAPLEVAKAGKPSPARIRAEPASQALAITKKPGSWCNARKRLAFSIWLDVMLRLLARLSALPPFPKLVDCLNHSFGRLSRQKMAGHGYQTTLVGASEM